jgi:hypothetical protein
MNRDRTYNSTPPLEIASLFRGLYSRVARQLGVDPSFVSRVARGERESEAVLALLTREIKSILDSVNHRDGASSDKKGKTRTPSAVALAVVDGASGRNGRSSRETKSANRRSSFAARDGGRSGQEPLES